MNYPLTKALGVKVHQELVPSGPALTPRHVVLAADLEAALAQAIVKDTAEDLLRVFVQRVKTYEDEMEHFGGAGVPAWGDLYDRARRLLGGEG